MKVICYLFNLVLLFTLPAVLIAEGPSENHLAAIIPDFQVNDNGGHSAQDNSAIAVGNNGNYILVWEDQRDEYYTGIGISTGPGGDIYAQILDEEGIPTGANFKVSDDTSNAGQFSPTVSVTGTGNFVVAWIDSREDIDHQNLSNIYAQLFDSEGSPSGKNIRVSDLSRIDNNETPVVAGDAAGNFVIAWAGVMGDTGSTNIYAQRYAANGTPQGSKILVNNYEDKNDSRSPVIAMNGSGEFIIVWEGSYQADRHPDIYAQRFSADGSPKGRNFIVDDYTLEEVYVHSPVIGMDDEWNFLIAWVDSRQGPMEGSFYGQWYDGAGIPMGKNFKLNGDQSALDPYAGYLGLAVAGDGSYCAFWNDMTGMGLTARRCSGDSTAQGNSFTISSGQGMSQPVKDPSIAMQDNGNIMISWTDFSNYTAYSSGFPLSDIFTQRVTGDSTLAGDPLRINDDYGSGAQINPDISVDPNGKVSVVWEDPRNDPADIYLRQYTEDGTVPGEQVKVNDDSTSKKNSSPSIAADTSGLVMIVWEDYRGKYSEIYGQFYSPEGAAIGTNFSITDQPEAGYFLKPEVAPLGNGKFVVTWQFTYAIGAQICAAGTGPVGDRIVVNDVQGDFKQRINPAVAADDSGNFVIVWEDRRSATDIYAQRYTVSGQPVGNNFRVTETGKWGIDPAAAFQSDGSLYIVFTGNGITLQRYAAQGGAVGGNVPITDPPEQTAYPRYPDISFDLNDRAVISWELVSVIGNEAAIQSRRLSDSGTGIGDAFMITGAGAQTPRLVRVALMNNRIHSVWIDNLYKGTSWDIYANILDFDDPLASAISDKDIEQVSEYRLYQNYPNPFNPVTTIQFDLAVTDHVVLQIFDISGRPVQTLINGIKKAGSHSVVFNAAGFASGIYFYRIKAGNHIQTRRMLLIK